MTWLRRDDAVWVNGYYTVHRSIQGWSAWYDHPACLRHLGREPTLLAAMEAADAHAKKAKERLLSDLA
jgi:hypothetical protein